MKRIVFSCLLILPLVAGAEDVRALFAKVEQSKVYKNYVHRLEAGLQQRKSELYDDGWSVEGAYSYAEFKDGSDSGNEYGLSIGKEFMLQSSKTTALLKNAQNYNEIAKKIKLNELRALLLKLYGNYCITMDALQAKGELAVVYESVQEQIDKGVEFGEFDSSKSIMAHLTNANLNLEISRLESELENYEAQIRSIVEFDGHFECQKMGVDFARLFETKRSLLSELLLSKKSVAHAQMNLASSNIQKLSAQAGYSDELDTTRYTFNVAIPLNFGSKKYESMRAAALQNYSAASYELEAFAQRYTNESKALKRQLKIYKKYVKDIERSITKASGKLIAQSKERFAAGEDSLIELLKATETKLQMIDTILKLKLQRHEAVTGYLNKYAIDPQGVMK